MAAGEECGIVFRQGVEVVDVMKTAVGTDVDGGGFQFIGRISGEFPTEFAARKIIHIQSSLRNQPALECGDGIED